MPVVRPFREFQPKLGARVFLAENATVVGDVELGEGCNIWYGAVLRGDVGAIRLGSRVNVQDLACIHMTKHLSDAILGDDVSIGHSAIVHGAIIERGVLIGMGAIIMDNARVGEDSIVGAGSLVTANTVIPPGHLAHGRPARVIRELTDEERGSGTRTALRYLGLADDHR